MVTFTIVDYWRYNPLFPKEMNLNDMSEKYENYEYHDNIFKEILEDKKEFEQFFNKYLKFNETDKKIEQEEIEKYNRKFIAEESETIYKIKERNVFIVVKYQNTIDYNMAEKMTKYCVELIRNTKKQNDIYPLICPIVLYTGEKKWDASLTINQMQEEYYGFPQLEYPKYNLVDINDYTKEELINENSGISRAMLFKKIKTKEEFIETLYILLNKNLSEEKKEYIQIILKYPNEIKEYIKKLHGSGNITKFENFFRSFQK